METSYAKVKLVKRTILLLMHARLRINVAVRSSAELKTP